MNNWIPKNKIVKFAVIIVSLSILLYFAGLWIVFNETKKIENFYRDTNSNLFKEERFWAIKSIAEINKEPIQTLRNFFVQKGDEVKFIEQTEGAAKASAIKFETSSINVNADSNSKNSFKENIDIRMNVEGSWGNIISFMDKLEKLPFGVFIQNINLDANVPGRWSGFIEFIIFREK
jgi:hypothetical protein